MRSCRCHSVLAHRSWNSYCPGGEVDLSQKIRQACDQSDRSGSEYRPDEPLQLDLKQDFQEERRDNQADQQCRERARSNCRACQVTPVLKALKFDLDSLDVLKLLRDGLLSQFTAPVNDASKTSRHHVEDAGNPGQQKYRCQRELDRVSYVSDVYC